MRIKPALLAVSASGLAAIAAYEGYSATAYSPVPGDKPTIGFGATAGVKDGDRTTPVKAVQRLARDAELARAGIARCVSVPLTQNELDVYVSFAYNAGTANFCRSTMARKLNAGDYAGACAELRRWVYFKGKVLPGLVSRREDEYRRCVRT